MPTDDYRERYRRLAERCQHRGLDLNLVKERLAALAIETPSWGYGNSGTRFNVFPMPGAARTVWERLDDAAQVHRYTGAAPTVALHIPWDRVDDWGALAAYAAERDLRIGSINPNLFQDQAYLLGSLTHEDPAVRRQAVAHVRECIAVMAATGSSVLSLWLPDGSNYPGQADFRRRKGYLEDGLAATYRELPAGARLLLEYKFFEPAFYHTELFDWGISLLHCRKLGERAQVLVDLGHHPQGTNIEQLVAVLLDEGALGGFHFNNRKYADDDLTTGSINPLEVFLICLELVKAEAELDPPPDIAYMIDQSHIVKRKIPAMIQSVVQIQRAMARALLVDREALCRAQVAGDVMGAEGLLDAAFNTDVDPLLAVVREEQGQPPDALAAYLASGHQRRLEAERVGDVEGAAGWG